MAGGTGDDGQDGGPGNDTIFANRGNDVSVGGDGNDVLWALARADVSGPGDVAGDTLDGGNGDDVFRTRDGEADRVTCGPGNDRALLDNVDVITDATPENLNGSCEFVQRKAPKASDIALGGRAGEAGRREHHQLTGPSPRRSSRPAAEPLRRPAAALRSRSNLARRRSGVHDD